MPVIQTAGLLDTDIFVPERWMGGDELPHQCHAFLIVHDFDLNTSRTQVVLGPLKRAILTNNNPGYAVQQYGAAAHIAGRQRRIEHRLAIIGSCQPPCILEAIHLGMQHGATLLNSLVMPTPDNLPFDDQH